MYSKGCTLIRHLKERGKSTNEEEKLGGRNGSSVSSNYFLLFGLKQKSYLANNSFLS